MKTTLLNPTPAQVKHRNRLWVEALLKNKRKARGEMYNQDGGRCCLAVAQDVAISCGLDIGYKKNSDSFPHNNVADFFGWGNTNPWLKVVINDKIIDHQASSLNDGGDWDGMDISNQKIADKGLSHKQISECVMNTFVHPSKPKQSFKL